MTVSNELIDQLLAGYKKPEDLIGENGLLKQLTKRLVERALEAETTATPQECPMPTIKINDQDYDADSLSAEAKTQLDMLLSTEAEIRRLQTQLAIAQKAKNAYARALAEAVK